MGASDGRNAKALMRRSSAYEQMEKYDHAIADAQAVLFIEAMGSPNALLAGKSMGRLRQSKSKWDSLHPEKALKVPMKPTAVPSAPEAPPAAPAAAPADEK